jgi:hypothetical protein
VPAPGERARDLSAQRPGRPGNESDIWHGSGH